MFCELLETVTLQLEITEKFWVVRSKTSRFHQFERETNISCFLVPKFKGCWKITEA